MTNTTTENRLWPDLNSKATRREKALINNAGYRRAPQFDPVLMRPFDVVVLCESAIDQVILWRRPGSAQALRGRARQAAIGARGVDVDRDDDLTLWRRDDLHVVGRAKPAIGQFHRPRLGIGGRGARLLLPPHFGLVGLLATRALGLELAHSVERRLHPLLLFARRALLVRALAPITRRRISFLQCRDFLAIIDGMKMDARTDIQAPTFSELDFYCEHVAVAVGSLSVRIFGEETPGGELVAAELGRALQLSNTLRDLAEDARRHGYLPREVLQAHGISATTPSWVLAQPAHPDVCRDVAMLAEMALFGRRGGDAACPRGTILPAAVMLHIYRAPSRAAGTRVAASRRANSPPRVAETGANISPRTSRTLRGEILLRPPMQTGNLVLG